MNEREQDIERQIQIGRYRAMEEEVTDPLAARLLRDIVVELEAELERRQADPRRAECSIGTKKQSLSCPSTNRRNSHGL